MKLCCFTQWLSTQGAKCLVLFRRIFAGIPNGSWVWHVFGRLGNDMNGNEGSSFFWRNIYRFLMNHYPPHIHHRHHHHHYEPCIMGESFFDIKSEALPRLSSPAKPHCRRMGYLQPCGLAIHRWSPTVGGHTSWIAGNEEFPEIMSNLSGPTSTNLPTQIPPKKYSRSYLTIISMVLT